MWIVYDHELKIGFPLVSEFFCRAREDEEKKKQKKKKLKRYWKLAGSEPTPCNAVDSILQAVNGWERWVSYKFGILPSSAFSAFNKGCKKIIAALAEKAISFKLIKTF